MNCVVRIIGRFGVRQSFLLLVFTISFSLLVFYSISQVFLSPLKISDQIQHDPGDRTGYQKSRMGVPTTLKSAVETKKVVKPKEELKDLSWKQVNDVIRKLGNDSHVNRVPTKPVQILGQQIRTLREAIEKEEEKITPMVKNLKCVGDLYDVEDLLCRPRPKYLKDVKNPCWRNDTSKYGIQCLPYFHILGCAKAGTTDLWNRLMSHPHVVSNHGLLYKEALWWSWSRYGLAGYRRRRPVEFDEYTDMFEDTARQVARSLSYKGFNHRLLITGDASPPDFWDFRAWRNISQNHHLSQPEVLTPHLMSHMYPNPKFILMFRDPIDRLYSDYYFVGGGLTAQDFHTDVLVTIDMLYNCLTTKSLFTCFHNSHLYHKLPVRLPFACYSLYMKLWLSVFPPENFLFIKTEDYEKNPEETLSSVFSFLGLKQLKDSKLEEIADEKKSRITLTKQNAGPMFEKTKYILTQLLKPCSQRLANMTGRSEFRWDT